MSKISSSLKKGAEGKPQLSKLSSIADFRKVRVQIEGGADSGKSFFILGIAKHFVEHLGWPRKKICMGLIDFDKEGIGPLLFAKVIPTKLQNQIEYKKIEKAEEAYDALGLMEDVFEKWEAKTGFTPWYFCDNMGEFWEMCQRDYGEKVTGKPYYKILEDKQMEAVSRDKKTLPVFDHLLDYRNINPIHNGFANFITRKRFNLCWSCLLTTRDFEENGEKIKRVVGAGQKGNEARVDFIFRRYREKIFKGTTVSYRKAYIDAHKLRGVSGGLTHVKPADFTTVTLQWYKMYLKEMKRKKKKPSEVPWLKPYKESETEEADRLGKDEEEAEKEVEAEEEDDDDLVEL
jgi:hypothetical protein